MKHILHILTFLLLATSAYTGISAQDYTPVPVTVSKEKVRVDGKLFYSHIVLERQTLYSICKAYDVTMEQIYEANPAVKAEGLKKNAVLLIPCPEKKAVQQEEKAPEQPAKAKKEKRSDKKQTIHTVKWYEDLDVIAEKYGVSVEAIMQANGLTGRKLSRRQKLVIPEATGTTVPAAADTLEVADGLSVNADIMENDNRTNPASAVGSRNVNAVLMLPFNASGEKPRNGSIDFYCGTLMAVKQAGDSGVDVELSVYDVEGGVLPVTRERLDAADIVIGPISAGDLSRLMVKCPSETFVVSPLDHKAEYLGKQYANFIQAPTSSLTLYEDLAGWIKEERQSAEEKVIVVYEKGARNIEEAGIMNTILEKDGIAFSTFSYSILEGRDIQESLMGIMSTEAANRILVMSESEAFVNDMVRNLNLLIHEDYDIVLYGPSKIRNFETIEVDNLHNTNFHTSLAYHVDYDRKDVRDFISRYRALFNTEPTPYAFQGYDIASYFLKICSESGREWKNRLETDREAMLQTDFSFEKVENGGYVNTGVKRIIYGPDYSITEIPR